MATGRSSSIAIGALKVAAISLVVIFVARTCWDVHQVTSFCADVKPGATLTSLSHVADEHGIRRRWVNGSLFDGVQKDWVFFVPVAATFGEVVCAVHHDNSVVVSAKMEGF